jgi:hypothetical protein
LLQMSEGRRSVVLLLDGRRLDIVIQPRLHCTELAQIVASHCSLRAPDHVYFALNWTDEKCAILIISILTLFVETMNIGCKWRKTEECWNMILLRRVHSHSIIVSSMAVIVFYLFHNLQILCRLGHTTVAHLYC